jgi:hypothetical protein
MQPTGHVDIAAAGLNADMMSINFSTDRRRIASAIDRLLPGSEKLMPVKAPPP